MKRKYFIFSLIFILILINLTLAKTVKVSSKISQIIVYPDKAEVIRKAKVKVTKDTSLLVFSNLPATFIPESIKATVLQDENIDILGAEIKTHYFEVEQIPEVKKLKDEIEKIKREIERLEKKKSTFEFEKNLLNSIAKSLSNQISKDLFSNQTNLKLLAQFLNFSESKLDYINENCLKIEWQIKEKKNELEALEKRLKDILPQKPKERIDVYLPVSVKKEGEAIIELKYIVRDAKWEPIYTIKAYPNLNKMKIIMSAKVIQKTGEDWQNVKLTFSTAKPPLVYKPGKLRPWYLNIYEPRRKREALFMEKAYIPKPTPYKMAGIKKTWVGADFEIQKLWNIPGDGAERIIPIDIKELKASFDYLCIPKLYQVSFLRGISKDNLPYPLLQGKANIFIEESFIGATEIEFIPAKEKLKFFFGEDKQIKVKRELIKKEKSSAGFTRKIERIHFVYKITLKNLREKIINIELKDQIPVSQNEKIKIKDVKITPEPQKIDEKGIITWEVSLKPQEEKNFVIDFIIEYPKKAIIIGL